MKLCVAVPSYKRPAQLITLLTALHQLASGKHAIEYRVGVQDGDMSGYQLIPDVGLPQYQVVKTGPYTTLGRKSNQIIAGVEADFYLLMPDDSLPITQHWDEVIVALFAQENVAALCWSVLPQPGQGTVPIFSRKWVETVGFVNEWFPYWFVDNWWGEVYAFAFGAGIPLSPNLQMGGKRGETRSLRDPEFWTNFFIRTREERMAQGDALAKAFNVEPFRNMRSVQAQCAEWDAFAVKHYPGFKEDGNPREEGYYKALEAARRHIGKLRLVA